jgi:hypothetical protein
MPRRIFDIILTTLGGLLTLALLLAGGLAMWAYQYTNTNVHDQLTQQQIFFPPAGSPALASPEIGPFLNQYAGQQLVDGRQAKAYADHFIAVHLSEVAGGKTYAQVSNELQQNKNDPTLKAQQQTLFQGETLRGLLLSAYAFWQLGQIALWASIGSFILAFVLLILTLLGLWQIMKGRKSDQMMGGGRRGMPPAAPSA